MKAKMEHYLLFTNSGMTYQYGNSQSSKIAYKNKSGFSRIASWYVNKVTDKYSNYITYITALDGGNFASAFVSAAASSGIGSYARAVYMNSNIL